MKPSWEWRSSPFSSSRSAFLVYHKMDLHQRQLTQASIGSTAETPDASAKPEEQSALLSGNVTGATTDPLLERSLVASDNAVANDEQEVPAFSDSDSSTIASNFSASSTMGLSEPAEVETNAPENQTGELVADRCLSLGSRSKAESASGNLLAGATTCRTTSFCRH
jgi:hypothetical protein